MTTNSSALSVSSAAKTIGAYARLLRLSNGPTAVADVWMGYAVVTGGLEPTWPLALMTLASLCLYHGGMALNDAQDAEQDATDNRGRPIAAGQISQRQAKCIALCLLILGVILATYAFDLQHDFRVAGLPFVLPLLLLAAIFFYNSQLKRTALGPLLMGTCRALNGLLGMSLAPSGRPIALVTPGILAYVVGLTVYARDEAKGGRSFRLFLGIALSLFGVGWLALAPWLFDSSRPTTPLLTLALFWTVTTLYALRGMVAGILQPTPKNIGRGVGIAIQGLVVIDATLATLYAGPAAGLAILALLPVTMLLARWIPQT